ncbi:sulfite exporter TauE/SafE family protein [Gilvimarinus sp. 1_MG-2023]|uniref:sulfite exporter TauE/SafE family protein n=1 Tax=Gilvimarinus sp. 1_MG-2023 TaxID=3062638 RepID=UPI0026E385FA|nr:sulfite exporter TauE/SafE family protein [Gilvimarinus sp. 1_MG-2023]MDO6747923.1 sulfite exporter TauE/SafE family protein [Gilvimarinus sp. 1_MG-2023]
MPTDFASFLVALSLGFFSSSHCLAMCGGIMGALTMAIEKASATKRLRIILAYNLGRIASYCLMGALAGLFAEGLIAMGAGPALRLLAAALLVAMALYITDLWRGLTRLERAGQWLWRWVQPFGKRFMPVRSVPAALALGGLWGWLPCGLVYTALSYALTQPGPGSGALFMLGFGLGTLPAVALAATLAEPVLRAIRSRWVRGGAALLLLLFAAWTVYGTLGGDHAHHQHQHSTEESGPEHTSSSEQASSASSHEPHSHHHHH